MKGRAAAAIGGSLWLVLTAAAVTSPAPPLRPPLPRAPKARIVTITPVPGFFNEPSLAVDGAHPNRILLGYQVNASAAWSDDFGRSWHVAPAPVAPRRYKVSGDVSVAFDAAGDALLCTIAFDKLGTYHYWAHGATRNGIFVRRSTDGGRRWLAPIAPVDRQPSGPGIPFEDKPYIAADTTHSRYRGNLYVGWTEFRLDQSLILFSRSSDGGRHWSRPAVISDHPGLPRDDTGAVEGFDATVTPNGAVNAVWSDGADIVFTQSRNGGRTFAPTRRILKTAASDFALQGVERANGFPQIGSDARGRLYVSWSDYRNGDLDVLISHSSDGGRHWSAPVRVNSDPIHDGDDQFFQWLAVDPVSGDVYVVFDDRRGDPANTDTWITLARSRDGGRRFANYLWTAQPFRTGGEFMGDYNALAAYGGRVYGAWTVNVAAPGQASPASSKPHHTEVQVGVADFSF